MTYILNRLLVLFLAFVNACMNPLQICALVQVILLLSSIVLDYIFVYFLKLSLCYNILCMHSYVLLFVQRAYCNVLACFM